MVNYALVLWTEEDRYTIIQERNVECKDGDTTAKFGSKFYLAKVIRKSDNKDELEEHLLSITQTAPGVVDETAYTEADGIGKKTKRKRAAEKVSWKKGTAVNSIFSEKKKKQEAALAAAKVMAERITLTAYTAAQPAPQPDPLQQPTDQIQTTLTFNRAVQDQSQLHVLEPLQQTHNQATPTAQGQPHLHNLEPLQHTHNQATTTAQGQPHLHMEPLQQTHNQATTTAQDQPHLQNLEPLHQNHNQATTTRAAQGQPQHNETFLNCLRMANTTLNNPYNFENSCN